MKIGVAPLLALGACAMTGSGPGPETPPQACDAGDASVLVGGQRSEEAGRRALKLTGAKTLRWISPGTAVTMDYRTDRANIYLDGTGKIERVTCG